MTDKIFVVTMWGYTKYGAECEVIGHFSTRSKAEDFVDWVNESLTHFAVLSKSNTLLCEYRKLFEQFIEEIREKGWKHSSVRRIIRYDCDNWVTITDVEVK